MLSSSLSSLARLATRRTALPAVGAVRNLNVHEYISMEIMHDHGIATPEGYVASTPEEAENVYMRALQHSKYRIESCRVNEMPFCSALE